MLTVQARPDVAARDARRKPAGQNARRGGRRPGSAPIKSVPDAVWCWSATCARDVDALPGLLPEGGSGDQFFGKSVARVCLCINP